ncbi:MAG: rhodanese-related sulfurtransferase, partial [Verrucomicrobiales bacterium]|nr:rhodanese-related sulfurtransferase [Verrucomicrobiales bacterium]
MEHTVATFYLFADLPDFEAKQAPIKAYCESQSVLGTIILAPEGINGTIAGPSAGITAALEFLRADERLAKLPTRLSFTDRKTFHRMRVILRPEIVTLGDPSVNPNEAVGQYVAPEDWNELINDPEVTLIDTRNDYEVEVGTFRGAIDPKTTTFGEWPEYVENNLDPEKHPKIAMFCTGGIRCEKASAHLLKNGFKEVFHLRGGILSYLEIVPESESSWEGDCFVFDHRVAVKHGLEQGDFEICFGCRWPISEEETRSPLYEPGVSCPRCVEKLTDERRARLRELHTQVMLARKRNGTHIGEQP